MKVTTVSRHVEIEANADFWELYNEPGRENAAACINQAIITAVGYRCTRADATTAALAMMEKFRQFGAVDSEALRALDEILDQIFGRDE